MADTEISSLFGMLGFGTNTIDAIMTIGKVLTNKVPGIEIKSITKDSIDDIMPLVRGLKKHIGSSPCYLSIDSHRNEEWFRQFLAEKDKSVYVAYSGNDAVSYIQCEPSFEARACYIVRHPEIIGITGAYTKSEFRNKGIASAILSRLFENALQKGYKKCSVDFESANLLASSFWHMRYKPVCYSMLRYIDERVISVD